MAIEAGASALGLVSEMPSGPGVISDELAAEIAAAVPPGVDAFLLTSRTAAWRRSSSRTGAIKARALQLVDALPAGAHARAAAGAAGGEARAGGPRHRAGVARRGRGALAGKVDAILLDSGNPSLEVKELGGTGRRHDWEISRRIREAIDVPLYLAGGLRPENAREAIETVGRSGSTSARGCAPARTSHSTPSMLERFMAAARGG